MSSSRVGIQAKRKEHAPLTVYTHCNSHILNLSIAASSSLPYIRNIISEISSKKTKLAGLCKTRWVERHTCYDTFILGMCCHLL